MGCARPPGSSARRLPGSGFPAHFAGGYVAGGRARTSGGLQGVMVALLGFAFVVAALVIVSAIVVATAGVVLAEGGISLPSLTLGFAGGAVLPGLILLALNILGGFFGGKLGEWETGLFGGPSPPRRGWSQAVEGEEQAAFFRSPGSLPPR